MPFMHVWSLHKHGVLGCSTHDPARGSEKEREVEIEEEREEGGEREGGKEGGKGLEVGEKEGEGEEKIRNRRE